MLRLTLNGYRYLLLTDGAFAKQWGKNFAVFIVGADLYVS
jgi:hypothetical protein